MLKYLFNIIFTVILFPCYFPKVSGFDEKSFWILGSFIPTHGFQAILLE